LKVETIMVSMCLASNKFLYIIAIENA